MRSWTTDIRSNLLDVCAETEVISLDEGIRLEGLPALQLWECVLGTPPKSEAHGSLSEYRFRET